MRVRELRIINISPPVSESESRVALIIEIMGSLFHCVHSANCVAKRFYGYYFCEKIFW